MTPLADQPRVAMIQDGARLGYQVPLALQRAGILERVFIDWFVREGSIEQRLARLIQAIRPAIGKKMEERSCPELDPRRIVRNPALALRLGYGMRGFDGSEEDSYIWASKKTAQWVIRKGFGRANALHGFVRNAAPEAYLAARDQGLRTSADQMIAPLRVEFAEMKEQIRRWPGWSERESIAMHAEYLQREETTWQLAQRMTCASQYVSDGLASVGVPPEKISVIPYPWSSDQPAIERDRKTGPLMVGFVGGVGLRKGAPYFLEVARRFEPGRVRFVMVGLVLLNRAKLGQYQDRVEIVGPVPRSEVASWLRRFDVFLFPSTCEGSAAAVMEAMGASLPILTSPNSGSVVRDGVDGFIRRYDDVEAFVQAIRQFDDDRDLMLRMGNAARQRVLGYDLTRYQTELLRHFQRLLQRDSHEQTMGQQRSQSI